MTRIKDWTVMIYANGNNELEPEIWQSRLDIEKKGTNKDYNILLQIGREARELVKIIRPDNNLPDFAEQWTGVRRYYFKDSRAVLTKNMGSINMAAPLCLYDFIKWSITNYPATKYILILGGHVYQFVGALTDYSQERPYIMGFPEMGNVFELVKENLNVVIDLLILDVCYLNFVEILYELSSQNRAVNYLLTYVYEGPLAGLPYDRIIEVLRENPDLDSRQLIKNIVDRIERKLVVFEINYNRLNIIKKLFNQLAINYLNIDSLSRPGINNYLNYSGKNNPGQKVLDKLKENLKSIIFYYRSSAEQNSLLNIARRLPDDLQKVKLYQRLSFNKGNNWVKVISKKTPVAGGADSEINMLPTVLSPGAIKANIKGMNPALKDESINKIFNKLSDYKKWNPDLT